MAFGARTDRVPRTPVFGQHDPEAITAARRSGYQRPCIPAAARVDHTGLAAESRLRLNVATTCVAADVVIAGKGVPVQLVVEAVRVAASLIAAAIGIAPEAVAPTGIPAKFVVEKS